MYKRMHPLNIAYLLSRLVLEDNSAEFESDNHFFVLAVQESVAIDVSEIEKVSKVDPELKAVRDCLESGNWNNSAVKLFERFKNELGMIVRGNKLVVCLRK